MMRRRTAVLLMLCSCVIACREGDGPADPSANNARIHLASSPNGAAISVDGRETGQVTPDTVAVRRGDRNIALRLDSAGYTYDYAAIVQISRTDTVIDVELPLGLQCLSQSCNAAARTQYDAAGMRLAVNAIGTLLYAEGTAYGLLWPATATNEYVVSGMPAFAGRANDMPVALGTYDQAMLVGRPAPVVTSTDGAFLLAQQAWILPPPVSQIRPGTVRGILIGEEIIAHDDVEGVIVLRLTFRNVSDDVLVHRFAPHIPASPVTYTDSWIGFMIDPDIGVPEDDWLSYDTDLDMVFAYDSDFLENGYIGPGISAPGLVGMRVLSAPAGAAVLLNSWSRGNDWSAGTVTEEVGFGMLTGSSVYQPDHPDPRIGFMPASTRDVRMSVTAGPLTLAPGEEAEIVIAIAVAAPAPGTFTSGVDMAPGDPFDTRRALYGAAAGLRARMQQAEALPGS